MIVFDDIHSINFYPLTQNRAVGDLRCGILKLRQRLQHLFKDDDSAVWIDPRLVPLYRERHPEWQINGQAKAGTLWVNSRLQVSPALLEAVGKLKERHCLFQGAVPLIFRNQARMDQLPDLDDLKALGYELVPSELATYNNLSDLIRDNGRMLGFDFEQLFSEKDNYFETEPGVTALHPYNIWIGDKVTLKPGVVLDASDGPIILDDGVRILPNAVITGPAYIGKDSVVKVGAKIYGNTSIGPVCKVGGEVEGSIFQSYSNKQHDGFLGHSYVGEWVNIGADTNNSDLKNTYKNVGFYSYAHCGKIDSGTLFLGALIADHAKLGINSSLNTGCVIGIGCNLWGTDLISDFIPDFSWGQACKLERYRFDAFCQTATLVKQRRQLDLSAAEKELYQYLYEKAGQPA